MNQSANLWGVAVGDFNGDGNLDLAVTNFNYGTVSIFLGTGSGGFNLGNYYSVPGAGDIITTDFNRDGKVDLAMRSGHGLAVMLGNGDGSFQSPVYTGSYCPYASLQAADFNNDGILDLVITAGDCGPNDISVLLGKGDGTFQPAITSNAPVSPGAVAVGDFNRDGKMDVAVGNLNAPYFSVLLGKGDGSFQPPTLYLYSAFTIAAGDFNNDGKVDLAIPSGVLLGHGDGTFGPEIPYSAGPGPLAVGDFNNDGNLDLVFTNGPTVAGFSNSGGVLLGNGDGTFQAPSYFTTGSNAYGIAVGDLNHDGLLDVVVIAFNRSTISVLLQTSVSLSPLALQFPNTAIGHRNSQAVTLTNLGSTAISFTSATITGPAHSDFSVPHQCPSEIQPGASCTLTVTFKPSFSGTKTASLSVFDGAVGPQSVPLLGTAIRH